MTLNTHEKSWISFHTVTASTACALLGGCERGTDLDNRMPSEFQRTNISQAVAEKVLISLVCNEDGNFMSG